MQLKFIITLLILLCLKPVWAQNSFNSIRPEECIEYDNKTSKITMAILYFYDKKNSGASSYVPYQTITLEEVSESEVKTLLVWSQKNHIHACIEKHSENNITFNIDVESQLLFRNMKIETHKKSKFDKRTEDYIPSNYLLYINNKIAPLRKTKYMNKKGEIYTKPLILCKRVEGQCEFFSM